MDDPSLSRRIRRLGASGTVTLDNKARQLRLAGRDIVSLVAGEPCGPPPEHVIAAAVRACHDAASHRYGDLRGSPALRSAIALSTSADLNREVEPDQVLVTNGAKQAVFEALGAILNMGDEVLIPTPHWPTYAEVVRWFGGVPVFVPTTAEGGWGLTTDALDAAWSANVTAIIVCSPCNPTGARLSAADVAAVGEWVLDRGLWLVTDDVYRRIVYDGLDVAPGLPAAVPELMDRTLLVDGVSKTYEMTGWRVGWVIGPPSAMTHIGRLHGHLTGNVAHVAQAAAHAALIGPQDCVHDQRRYLKKRRDRLYAALLSAPGVSAGPVPKGAFYCFCSIDPELGTSSEVAASLLDEAGVAVTPGDVFGAPGHLRLSFAGDDESLHIAIDRLHLYFQNKKQC